MADDTIIKVDNVYKKYKVYFDKGKTLKERLLFRNRNYYEDRWVLKGVSLETKKGESIGIIGKNGAGKSTLLKLMTRIMYPDQGNIEMVGRISSLLEMGAGFHPDMTGRENIYINASIFGLSKQETDARLQDIIDFSELSNYLDNPVRTYSSGMYVRLAFAIAINVDADILLADEVLAVGDAAFSAKCIKKMHELQEAGMTIAIVAHGLGTIEAFCNRTYWINDGIIAMQGPPKEVHTEYLKYMLGTHLKNIWSRQK
ncbi:teichoic acids export ATP-binding protein TagH (Teichoicacid-transporting ATPase) [Treponema primitia ZAS-2]|uniref:Teichoic acids export ATP-binding protein TagH (Teichoicacid-transporting ATPase) n=1 Tax=Treponema primitia (strain ATCC BAA-887 / DSM 12427 / ZAS-2) TaxID=545694 RepID=F5YGN9_TREPZ|nr:ABC transporter ATP-binding protein [Treponema primitia]AEF86126.1 teichoic acids export ATP-binding protein TagH (Teichoicacid-transporting ATPase) [Treponema primitia ZAS-2]